MIPVTLLGLIIIYEIFRAVKLDDYQLVNSTLKSLKGKKKEDKEYDIASEIFLKNKHYFLYIGFEYLYLIVLVVLLFTQYWLVSLLVTIQGVVTYFINKNRNKPITYIDTAITILIIVVGLILI